MTDTHVEMSSSDADKFLDAEEAASRLADALASLEVDVKGYRKATTDLASVAEATVRLASEIEEVGKKSSVALDVLVNMGGPHIAKQLGIIEQRNKELDSQIVELQRLERHNGSEIERVRASSQAAVDISERNRIYLDDSSKRIQKLQEEVLYFRDVSDNNNKTLMTINEKTYEIQKSINLLISKSNKIMNVTEKNSIKIHSLRDSFDKTTDLQKKLIIIVGVIAIFAASVSIAITVRLFSNHFTLKDLISCL